MEWWGADLPRVGDVALVQMEFRNPVLNRALTAERCVSRIYTSLAVIDVTPEGLTVREMVDGLTIDELQAKTAAPLKLADGWQPLTAAAM